MTQDEFMVVWTAGVMITWLLFVLHMSVENQRKRNRK